LLQAHASRTATPVFFFKKIHEHWLAAGLGLEDSDAYVYANSGK
jgi:hypothetical protein